MLSAGATPAHRPPDDESVNKRQTPAEVPQSSEISVRSLPFAGRVFGIGGPFQTKQSTRALVLSAHASWGAFTVPSRRGRAVLQCRVSGADPHHGRARSVG